MSKEQTIGRPNDVRITKGGKLYVKSSDFIKRKEVQELMKKLENSEIIKRLDKKK